MARPSGYQGDRQTRPVSKCGCAGLQAGDREGIGFPTWPEVKARSPSPALILLSNRLRNTTGNCTLKDRFIDPHEACGNIFMEKQAFCTVVKWKVEETLPRGVRSLQWASARGHARISLCEVSPQGYLMQTPYAAWGRSGAGLGLGRLRLPPMPSSSGSAQAPLHGWWDCTLVTHHSLRLCPFICQYIWVVSSLGLL